MTFLQPWMLVALPLVALPLIIHLINQRRFQTVRWAAMQFLLAAKALSALAMGNEPNQLAAVSLLVAGLVRTAERAAEADHDDLRERLIKTLWRLVRDNSDSQLNIARAGGADHRQAVFLGTALRPR